MTTTAETFEALRGYEKPKRKTLFGLRRSAIGETIIALALLIAIDMLGGNGNRFWSANPHPFWFIVLLISTKYGTREGTASALACSIALLLGNMPEHDLSLDGYAYAMLVLKLPLLWLVSSVIFGELRQMHIRERNKLEYELEESEKREERIAQSYQWVKELKDKIETRMAGQLRSSIAAYHAARKMESLAPAEVLNGLSDLISATLHPEQFSIYSVTDKGFDLIYSSGWRESDSYNRQFSSGTTLYKNIAGKNEVLCVANPDHERILAGQGMLAGSLVDRESGTVVGMLKIEKLGFTDLNLSNVEAFATICEWAGIALNNATKYQTAKADNIVNAEHNLLTSSYFKRYTTYMTSLAQRVGFDVSMIGIRITNASEFDHETRIRISRALASAVDSVLRNVDLAFDHQSNSEEYSIVLPATSQKSAQMVLDKIRNELIDKTAKIAKNATFSFSIQSVYEKRAA